MRIVVTGASGNVGTSLLDALSSDPEVDSILGLARRVPRVLPPKTDWRAADVAHDDLGPHLRGADVVVHLAWLIQPARDQALVEAVNVEGSRRVFDAVARERVPALVYASSVGAYSAGPKDRLVDESWPTGGIPTSFYSRHKAAVERLLDAFESEHPGVRAVRLRPGLVFKGEAATGIRRLFAGPLLPSPLVRPSLIAAVPKLARLRFQAVHSRDVAGAYRLAALSDASGAFNVAAEPVLDGDRLADLLRARALPLRAGPLRAGISASWRLRLQPTPPGWLDMALGVPLMDCTRARTELRWAPSASSEQALLELLEGMAAGAGRPTPPLDPKLSGPLRLREFVTGVGGR